MEDSIKDNEKGKSSSVPLLFLPKDLGQVKPTS